MDDETGNLGIGTSFNGQRKINVINAPSVATSTNVYGVYSEAAGLGTGSRYGVYGEAAVSTGNRYGVYGRAGGSTGSGRWGVYCDGNFWYTGTLTSTSDARFKSNVRNLESSLALVMAMKPRRYQFQEKNDGMTLAEGPQIGFLAQELEEILPELVETNMHDVGIPGEEGEQVEIKGINYIGLIPVLTRAIQELQTELERVTKELNNLKLQVNGQ